MISNFSESNLKLFVIINDTISMILRLRKDLIVKELENPNENEKRKKIITIERNSRRTFLSSTLVAKMDENDVVEMITKHLNKFDGSLITRRTVNEKYILAITDIPQKAYTNVVPNILIRVEPYDHNKEVYDERFELMNIPFNDIILEVAKDINILIHDFILITSVIHNTN